MRTGPALQERGAELDALARLIDAAERGDGGVVVVEGEAGIGKSTLLAAAAERAAARGFMVRVARGGELEQAFGYGLVRQLLAPEARAATDLDPAVAAALGAGPAGPRDRFAADHGLYWLVDGLATMSPMLLCVDDAQWADEESLGWLVHLARRLDGVRAAVVVTRRPDAAGPGHQALLAEAAVLHPAVLSAAACAALVRAARPDADDELCAACHRACGGNPFLLTELLPEVAAGADVDAADPEPVRRSVARRLAQLDAAATEVARSVAVLDTDAAPHRIAQLTALPVGTVLATLGDLQDCGLLAPELPPRFAHPMLRSAVHRGVPSSDRARRHAAAARLLVADPARAAAHLLRTPPLGEGWAVECLRAAAAALDGASAASAARLLGRALEEEPVDRVPILLALGRAERLLGHAGSVEHLRAAVAVAAAPDDRVPAAVELGLALGMAGRTVEAVTELERILDDLPDPGSEPALRLNAVLLAMSVNSGVAHHRLAARATRTLDAVGPTVPGAALLADVVIGYHLRQADTPFADLAPLAGLARLAEPSGHDAPLGIWVVAYHSVTDDLDAAQEMADRAIAAARRHGGLAGQAFLLGFRAVVLQRRGELLAAETAARAAIDLADAAGAVLPRLSTSGFLVSTLVLRGDLMGADAVLDGLGLATAAPPPTTHGAALLAERAALRLAQNRCAEARADAEACLARWAERGSRGLPGPARLVLAETSRRAGDLATARGHAVEEWEIARHLGLPSPSAVALAALGVIEGGEPGLAMLDEAATATEGSPCRLRHAGILADLGSALRRARRPVEAREPLSRALEIAHRSGATPLADRVHTELLASGARPRRPVRSGADALTAAERRVVWLAAEGRTNREIAQELFVTRRTVETHLGAAYRKLRIASRAELPRWRAQHG